jgi:hypothetical protein
MENIFLKIEQQFKDASDKRKERKEQTKYKEKLEQEHIEKMSELKALSGESQAMLQDNRYPKYNAYLNGLKDEAIRNLISVNSSAKTKEEAALMSARFSAIANTIELIINRPKEMINLLNDINKGNE